MHLLILYWSISNPKQKELFSKKKIWNHIKQCTMLSSTAEDLFCCENRFICKDAKSLWLSELMRIHMACELEEKKHVYYDGSATQKPRRTTWEWKCWNKIMHEEYLVYQRLVTIVLTWNSG
jgi:hypothetical protein